MQLPRQEVMGALAAAQPGWAPYYEHRLSPRCSVAVLDTTEVSLQGPLIDEARAFLAQRPRPPEALSANGGVGPAQLAWLRDDVLRRARAEGRRVIVAGHNPLLAEASRPGGYTRAFGWQALAELLDEHADVCPLYLAGHFHGGGYSRRASGVHHVTVEGIVEEGGHAVLQWFDDRIQISGMGGTTTRLLPLDGGACCQARL